MLDGAFSSTHPVSGQWVSGLLTGIGQHARHISRYLSYYFSPNTHLSGEALGLFYAGTLFPEFRDAARWRSIGTRVLLAESRSQLFSDGVHFEQSTCYHTYTLDTYLHFVLLAARNGVTLPDHLVEQVDTCRVPDFRVSRTDRFPALATGWRGRRLLPLAGRQRGGTAADCFAVRGPPSSIDRISRGQPRGCARRDVSG